MDFCITKFVWKHIRKQIIESRRRRIQASQSTGELTTGSSSLSSTIFENSQVKESDLSSPFFDFYTIAQATNNFSYKLGEGGFGPVYKGKLPNGQEIAIKRLSTKSGQGSKEFKNEVQLITHLQHRNLVRLLGCCIHGEEKLLLYEFMPNKSLDTFLFNKKKGGELDWAKRFKIIQGIARGLLYLHQDSRLRIIHRDMKAGNILLDEEFNPKISDFGMAQIFLDHQNQAMTNRIVGTYGYMSPEYAMEGRFSEKSDVYSFGVLLLEIITGKKITSIIDAQFSNLLGYAWTLWNEKRATELIDPLLNQDLDCDEQNIIRCIQVGLLCVQELPNDRPAMSHVLTMLSGDLALNSPKQAAFSFGRMSNENKSEVDFSVNELSYTHLDGR
ncbi:hypothetical protein LUZ60_013364 [Juncus effusus]|nr:hypothetical protein LUZ60_013364 [Juncus effusus]